MDQWQPESLLRGFVRSAWQVPSGGLFPRKVQLGQCFRRRGIGLAACISPPRKIQWILILLLNARRCCDGVGNSGVKHRPLYRNTREFESLAKTGEPKFARNSKNFHLRDIHCRCPKQKNVRFTNQFLVKNGFWDISGTQNSGFRSRT